MDMTLLFTRKEDLRLQLFDLQHKLAESEEERKKLEKTCAILIRAFKEEEKMRYKALNNKYEKFLEDCQTRRRRNDVILRTLCRIEDRARVLFTKTERLKLLKDRYISYVNAFEVLQNETILPTTKAASVATPPKSFVGDKHTSKSVHWKTPERTDQTADHIDDDPVVAPSVQIDTNDKTSPENYYKTLYEFYAEKYKTPTLGSTFLENPQSKDSKTGYRKTFDTSLPVKNLSSKDNWKTRDISRGSKNSHELSPYQSDKTEMNEIGSGILRNTKVGDKIHSNKNDKVSDRSSAILSSTNGLINFEEKDLNKVRESREKFALKHQESIEKLKSVLLIEESRSNEETGDQKVVEKDEIENNEKSAEKPHQKEASLGSRANDQNSFSEASEEESKDAYSPPKGLDGVDYDNETYPESYYEQPVHQRNYSSLASNVILEEDESEPDVEQPETSSLQQHLADKSRQSVSHQNFIEPSFKGERTSSNRNGSSSESTPNKYDGLKDQGSDSERSKFEESERQVRNSILDTTQGAQNVKPTPQSTIAQLLESDSESFQIEHGDLASGNEDSDFDFSFRHN